MHVRSLDTKKVSKAMDFHRKDIIGNYKLDKVFHAVIRYMSHGVRKFTYNDLCELTGLSYGSVKYYFNKLVYVGAIKLEEKEV